jgi:hypothetical protein
MLFLDPVDYLILTMRCLRRVRRVATWPLITDPSRQVQAIAGPQAYQSSPAIILTVLETANHEVCVVCGNSFATSYKRSLTESTADGKLQQSASTGG